MINIYFVVMAKSSTSYLPESWNDDTRMASMFSTFRNRNVNPVAYDSKMSFWIEAVNKFCDDKCKIKFEVCELEAAFKRNERIPSCLDFVVTEMKRQKTVMSLSELMMQSESRSWLYWSYDMAVKQPVQWGWKKLASSVLPLSDQVTTNECLVNVNTLKAKSVVVLSKLKAIESKDPVQFEEVLKMCQEICDSDNLDLILSYLDKTTSCLKYHNSDGVKFVKILGKDDMKAKDTLTDMDISVIKIRKTQKKIEDEIKYLEHIIERQLNEAKNLLKNDSRSKAKTALRRKKMLETMLAKREVALENIITLLNNIEEAKSHKMITEAYQAGVAAYKTEINESGLNIGSLDDTMDSVQQAIDMHEDITHTISSPIDGSSADLDTAELELELANIVAAECLNESESQDSNRNVDMTVGDVPDIDDLEARLEKLRSNSPKDALPSKSSSRHAFLAT